MARHWPLLPILILAALLRLHAIDRSPLWTDELFSLQSTAARGFLVETIPRMTLLSPAPRPTSLENPGPLSAIYSTQATDTHPPLYFMLLRLWREVFESSPTSLRIPSLLASLATVAALYSALALSASRHAAILAGLLAAVASSQIIFAHEVRGYALAAAFTTSAAALLLHIQRNGWTRTRAALLALSAVLAICTLYLAAIPLAALGVYSALHLPPASRRRTLLTGLAAAALAAALLTPLLLQQRLHLSGRNAWLVSDLPRTPVTIAPDLAAALTTQLAPLQDRSLPAAFLAAALLVLLAIPLYRAHPPARLWLLWILASLGTLAAWDLLAGKTHLQLPRYTLLAAPAVIALLASLASLPASRTARFVRAVPYAALLLCLVSLPESYRVTKEDWHIIRSYSARGDALPTDLYLVSAHSPRHWDNILYLGLSHYLPPESFSAVISSSPSDDFSALQPLALSRTGLVLLTEFDTNPSPAIPPGWRRTALTNLPSLGTLQTYRPPLPPPPHPLPSTPPTPSVP